MAPMSGYWAVWHFWVIWHEAIIFSEALIIADQVWTLPKVNTHQCCFFLPADVLAVDIMRKKHDNIQLLTTSLQSFFALFGILLNILSFLKCLLTEIVFIYISCNTQHVFTSHWRTLNKFHCLQTWFTKLPPCFTPVSTLLSFYVVYICRNVSNNPNFAVHAPERLCFSHSCFLKYMVGNKLSVQLKE